jgi:hypothetical protein
LLPAVYVADYDSSIVTTYVSCHQGTKALRLNNYFIFTLKTWSFGPGQSSPALPEELLQEFEVN